MRFLLNCARLIDALIILVGRAAVWLVFGVVLLIVALTTLRLLTSHPTAAIAALYPFLFIATVLLRAAYSLQRNDHLRISWFVRRIDPRCAAWIDVAGHSLLAIPFCVGVVWLSWSFSVLDMGSIDESLCRFIAEWLGSVALFFWTSSFALLAIQAFSEAIKRAAYLLGVTTMPSDDSGT